MTAAPPALGAPVAPIFGPESTSPVEYAGAPTAPAAHSIIYRVSLTTNRSAPDEESPDANAEPAGAEAMIKSANAEFDVAKEKCDALSGVVQDSCVSTAEAALAASIAASTAIRDAALMQAEHRE